MAPVRGGAMAAVQPGEKKKRKILNNEYMN